MARKRNKVLREIEKEEAELNLTPMIDVVFLLLIFFLCIDFKTLEAKLAAYLPKDLGVNTTDAEPIEKIDVRIICPKGKYGVKHRDKPDDVRFELIGHVVIWEVNAKRLRTADALRKELGRIAKDKQLDPKTGKRKPRPMTIHAYQNVTYGDVSFVIDLAKDVGFEEINFGGSRGAGKKG